MGVTIVFHFFFRRWASAWDYYPMKQMINLMYEFLTQQVYMQSKFMIKLFFKLNEGEETRKIIFAGGGYIGISAGCSGLKQMMQCVIVLLLTRGSFGHKLWFIPFGILMMHLSNLARILGLSFFVVYAPDYWNFAHDYFFRPLFYVVIFGLWVWWEERFRHCVSLRPE